MEASDLICMICLEEVPLLSPSKLTDSHQCLHKFCYECLYFWVKKRDYCPLCYKAILNCFPIEKKCENLSNTNKKIEIKAKENLNNFSYYKKIIEEKVNSCNKLLLNLKSSITTKKLSKISFLEDVLLELYDFKLETNEDFLISGLSRLDSLLYKVEIGNWDKIPLNNSKETLEKEGCVVYEGNTLKMINDIPVIKNKFKKRK